MTTWRKRVCKILSCTGEKIKCSYMSMCLWGKKLWINGGTLVERTSEASKGVSSVSFVDDILVLTLDTIFHKICF